MEEFLQLRSYANAYKVFFKYFVKCVTRKTLYENKLEVAKKDEDLCTISDEAFALLLLENNWDHWTDIYSKNSDALVPKRGRSTELISNIATKYTKGGVKYGTGSDGSVANKESSAESKSTENRKGWSTEGIRRFNSLYLKVKEDREKNKRWFTNFVEEARNECKDKKVAVATKNKDEDFPAAMHSLFDEINYPTGNEAIESDESGNKKDDGVANKPLLVNPLADSDDSSDSSESEEDEE